MRRGRAQVVAVALGQPDGADVEARREVSVISSVDPPPTSTPRCRLERPDAAQRQRRLLVAGQQTRREAVRPLDLAEERLAVLRVAHRARRDGERALGAERLELAPVVVEHVAHAGDRHGEQAPARVDAFAEPRDARAAQHLLDVAVLDVGDEQAGGVRAEVDRGDAHHLRGTAPRNREQRRVPRPRRPEHGELASDAAAGRAAVEPLRAVGEAPRAPSPRGGRRARRRARRGASRAAQTPPGAQRAHAASATEPTTATTRRRAKSRSEAPREHRNDGLVSRRCYNRRRVAGWSSQVARRAHNPEVAGSNPAPAIQRPGDRAFSCREPARLVGFCLTFALRGTPARVVLPSTLVAFAGDVGRSVG